MVNHPLVFGEYWPRSNQEIDIMKSTVLYLLIYTLLCTSLLSSSRSSLVTRANDASLQLSESKTTPQQLITSQSYWGEFLGIFSSDFLTRQVKSAGSILSNLAGLLSRLSVDNSRALHSAAIRGDCEEVERLIESGVSVNASNANGATPIYIASQEGHSDIVSLLIESGAYVNAAINDGYTPLMIASQNGHFKVVEQIIESGADVNAAIKDGVTPLYIASQNGHLEVVKRLI